MKDNTKKQPIQIYQSEDGSLEIQIDQKKDTVWLNLNEISSLFNKDKSVISRHIKNIFNEEELVPEGVIAKNATTGPDGKTYQVTYYNLDMILSIGYRTNSKRATRFRQWANQVLNQYLLQGYSLNQKMLSEKTQQIKEIQKTLHFLVKSSHNLPNQDLFLEVLSTFTSSLITLNQYDEDRLTIRKGVDGVNVEIKELREIIKTTKRDLIDKQEATDLFGQENQGKFEASIGAVYQTYGEQDLYPGLEEKAANLLYLIIKNHGFVDGNKRIGSILFVYYLAKNNFLYKKNGDIKINDITLVALALLIAQSDPNQKDILIKLIIKLVQD